MLNWELLKLLSLVVLYRYLNVLVEILFFEVDLLIFLLSDVERSDVKYSDIGGADV